MVDKAIEAYGQVKHIPAWSWFETIGSKSCAAMPKPVWNARQMSNVRGKSVNIQPAIHQVHVAIQHIAGSMGERMVIGQYKAIHF